MRFSIILSLLTTLIHAVPTTEPATAAAPLEIRAATGGRLIAYVQTFHTPSNQALSIRPLLDQKTRVTHVMLAALHINEVATDIHLNDDPFDSSKWDTLWTDVKALQAAGIKVMVMMGGAAAGTYKRLSGTDDNFHKYYDPLIGILRRYGFDGIDLDIEEQYSLSDALRLVKRLRADMGDQFIITMAPVASALLPNGGNLSGFSYFDLDSQAVDSAGKKIIAWYNGQFYNGWGTPSLTWYRNIINAGWSADRVVMGVLTNPGNGNGFIALSQLSSIVQDIRRSYPQAGGAVGWEYFNSGLSENLSNPWQWVQRMATAVLDALPSKRFALAERREDKRLVSIKDMERPRSPFAAEKVKTLEEGGHNWSQAHAALNRTNGNLIKAQALLQFES